MSPCSRHTLSKIGPFRMQLNLHPPNPMLIHYDLIYTAGSETPRIEITTQIYLVCMHLMKLLREVQLNTMGI
jgi:hypothetical protein